MFKLVTLFFVAVTLREKLWATVGSTATAPANGVRVPPFDREALIYLGSHNHDSDLEDVLKSDEVQTGSHYFLSVNSATWYAAQEDCKSFLGGNATLAYLETKSEFDSVEKMIRETDATITSLWVGGEAEGGSFQWGDRTPFGDWIRWDEGHPATNTSVTKVAAFNLERMKLRTQFQTVHSRYMCEVSNNGPPLGNDTVGPKYCPKQNDLVIILDSSGSLSSEQFRFTLEFTQELTTVWLANGLSRVSVILYSSTVTTLFSLNQSKTINEMQLIEMIQSAPHFQESSSTHLGLEQACSEFIASGNDGCGSDDGVPQNAVIFTDGKSTYPVDTMNAAARLLSAGIRTFSIAVGNEVNEAELLIIAGQDSRRVFNVGGNATMNFLDLLAPVSVAICAIDDACYAQ